MRKKSLKPQECYFVVYFDPEMDGTYTFVTSKEYFDVNGHTEEQTSSKSPEGWIEAMENIYQPDDESMSLIEAHNDLVKQGYIFNEKVAKFLSENEETNYYEVFIP